MPNKSAPATSRLEGEAPALGGVAAAEPWRVTPSETGGGGDGDEAQRTAVEVKSEAAGDGGAAFLAASAAGGMSERVPPTVFTGAGDDGDTASSRSRFLTERTGPGALG